MTTTTTASPYARTRDLRIMTALAVTALLFLALSPQPMAVGGQILAVIAMLLVASQLSHLGQSQHMPGRALNGPLIVLISTSALVLMVAILVPADVLGEVPALLRLLVAVALGAGSYLLVRWNARLTLAAVEGR